MTANQTMRQRPLLGSGPRAAMEVLLEAMFSVWCAPRLYHATERDEFSSVEWIGLWVIFFIGGVGLSPGTAATSGLFYKPQMIDDDDCGAISGMKIGRGNRRTRRKPAPAPLCPPQIPHDQTRARTPGRRGGKPATNRLSYGAAFGEWFNWRTASVQT
jgi:hypothetical protein